MSHILVELGFKVHREFETERAVTEGNDMAAAETSRMLRFVASVPVLTFPPPPKPSPLGFQRVEWTLRFPI
jgi:hypothetical protein